MTQFESEEWRPVVGYEGLYEVSNKGRVRSLDRIVDRKNGTARWPGRTLKPQLGSKGHYGVNLWRGKRSKTEFIHRLVAVAFIPNPDNLPLVRHFDDVKENNSVENLAWGTWSDNAQDAIRNGRDFNRQQDKSHCPKGHPYSGSNLYISPSGARHCRACKTLYQQGRGRDNARERRLRGLPLGDPRHGTLNGYSNYACRCDACVRSYQSYKLKIKESNK